MSTLPQIITEVGFGTGVTSGVSTWTDLSSRLRGFSSRRGRVRELDRFGSGSCTTRLKNLDRALEPLYAASPYYPNVVPNLQVRQRAVWNSVTYPVWRGFLDADVPLWPSNADAEAQFVATDGFEILNQVKLAATAFELELRQDIANARAWFKLGESQGAPVGYDALAKGFDGSYQGSPTLGVPSQVVGDHGTSFNPAHSSDQRLLVPRPDLITGYPFEVEFWMRVYTPNRSEQKVIFSAFDAAANFTQSIGIVVDSTGGPLPGGIQASVRNGATTLKSHSSITVDDASAHHIAVKVASSTSMRISVDGTDVTVVDSATSTPFPDRLANGFAIGNAPANSYGDYGFNGGLYGGLQHLVVWNGLTLTSARTLAHADAGKNAWYNDPSGVRLVRLLTAARWGQGELIDTGQTTLVWVDQDQGSGSALERMQQVTDSESGLLFIDRAGNIVFRDRQWHLRSPYRTSQATFGDLVGTELPYQRGSPKPSFDRREIYNQAQMTRWGGILQESNDPISQSLYGIRAYPGAATNLLLKSDAEAKDKADYYVSRYKQPKLRFEEIVIDPRVDPTNLWPQVLGREIGDLITVNRRPPGGGSALSQQVRIEGISHDVDATARTWRTTFAVSPADLNAYAVADDATLDVADSVLVGY